MSGVESGGEGKIVGTFPSLQERRGLLTLIAAEGPDGIAEAYGGDVVPFVLQAICAELVALSVRYGEEIPPLKDSLVFLGGMTCGLLFGEEQAASGEDEEDPVIRLKRAARRQGAAILAATGVPPAGALS